jgi:hypothetical protein
MLLSDLSNIILKFATKYDGWHIFNDSDFYQHSGLYTVLLGLNRSKKLELNFRDRNTMAFRLASKDSDNSNYNLTLKDEFFAEIEKV